MKVLTVVAALLAGLLALGFSRPRIVVVLGIACLAVLALETTGST